MRILALFLWIAIAAIGFAQDSQTESLFKKMRVDASIVVKKHTTGADMVEITLLNPNYPPELLKERIAQIGKELGVEPRGTYAAVYQLGDNASLKFVKGGFAVDGIVDLANHRLRIQPLLRGLVGDPAPFSLQGFSIVFDSIHSHPSYVQTFRTEAVRAEARAVTGTMPGIEYRIWVTATHPKDVEFPDYAPEPKLQPAPSKAENRTPIGGWIAIGAAAVSAGALVYLALLRSGAGNSRKKG